MVLIISQQEYDSFWDNSLLAFEVSEKSPRPAKKRQIKISHFGNYPEFTQPKTVTWNAFVENCANGSRIANLGIIRFYCRRSTRSRGGGSCK